MDEREKTLKFTRNMCEGQILQMYCTRACCHAEKLNQDDHVTGSKLSFNEDIVSPLSRCSTAVLIRSNSRNPSEHPNTFFDVR